MKGVLHIYISYEHQKIIRREEKPYQGFGKFVDWLPLVYGTFTKITSISIQSFVNLECVFRLLKSYSRWRAYTEVYYSRLQVSGVENYYILCYWLSIQSF